MLTDGRYAACVLDRNGLRPARYLVTDDDLIVMASEIGVLDIPEEKIVELINKHFDLTPKGIIAHLNLKRPIYKKTAAYGHFGRDEPEFTWERTDRADDLRTACGV